MSTTAMKRLGRELQEIRLDEHYASTEKEIEEKRLFTVRPLEDNFLDWHFTIRGPDDTPYSSGIYHGRIEFPTDYPFSPPNFLFLTPNGRFHARQKICLSVTTFHRETWQASWCVRTMLLAIREHFRVEDKGAYGYVNADEAERTVLARRSHDFRCLACGFNVQTEETNLVSNESGTTPRFEFNLSTILLISIILIMVWLLLRLLF